MLLHAFWTLSNTPVCTIPDNIFNRWASKLGFGISSNENANNAIGNQIEYGVTFGVFLNHIWNRGNPHSIMPMSASLDLFHFHSYHEFLMNRIIIASLFLSWVFGLDFRNIYDCWCKPQMFPWLALSFIPLLLSAQYSIAEVFSVIP